MGTNDIPAQRAFNRIVAAGAPLYAVVDAARESSVLYEAGQAGVECVSLYAGRLGERLRHVAPHLVDFRGHTTFRDWWFEQWGNSVGVIVEAPVSLAELRRHFRTLMMVRGADRNRYYFRFYDPRVLREFLPVCTAEEVERFFGPITAMFCENNGGTELLTFQRGKDGVEQRRNVVGGIAGRPAP